MSLSTNFPAIRPSLLLDFANTGSLDPRVTFTRSTTGVYYDGVTTAKAEQNLLLRSQEFDNASWTKTDATIAANSVTAPDGTSTGDKLIENTATGTHGCNQNITPVSGASYVVSIYAKEGERSLIRIAVGASFGSKVAFVDLSSGTITSESGTGTASVANIGNGWYRIALVVTAVSSVADGLYVRIVQSGTTFSYTGDGTSGLYIWGAQVEQRSAVSSYTVTTTQPITTYIPVLQTAAANVARFDHNPTTGEALGLLIEEQRTNLFTYSSDFSNAAWTKTRSSITANTIVAPDGTLTGDELIADTENNSHFVSQSPTITATAHTFSFYAKTGEYYSVVQVNNQHENSFANFDLSTGSLGTVVGYTATMTLVGNGWYRCTATLTFAAGAFAQRIAIVPSPTSARLAVFAGNGYSGIFIWGAQIEAGAFPTSYIPTTTAATTRTADGASMTGTNFSSWYNQGEGTLYAEMNTKRIGGNEGVLLTSGTSSYRIFIGPVSASGQLFVIDNNVTQAQVDAGSPVVDQWSKTAGAFKANDFAVSFNGSAAAIDSSGTVPVVDRLNIVSGPVAGTNSGVGYARKIAYYPLRLTNAELQALTS